VISDFRHKADDNCALLGYYGASGGNFTPAFRDKLSVSLKDEESILTTWRERMACVWVGQGNLSFASWETV